MTIEATKRPVEETESAIEAPVEKKQRSSCNFDALQKQVEYYMSDANLKHDKFFHCKISEDENGWLSLDFILACNKIKSLTTQASDIAEAMKTSSIVEVNEASDALRRKNPLPAFEGELKRTIKAGKDKHPAIHKKQIQIGEFKFPNLTAAKKRVGEILKSRRAGVIFKEGTPDYNLVLAVFGEHPNAAAKMEGMTGIKVDIAPQGESRCFYIVKGDNKDQFEDISIVKAFANFEDRLINAFEEKSAPVAAATEEPVAVATEEPAAVPTEEPAAVATEEPAVVATEEPAAVVPDETTA